MPAPYTHCRQRVGPHSALQEEKPRLQFGHDELRSAGQSPATAAAAAAEVPVKA